MGSYGTPQLLLVSGIGPKSEVEKLGVKSQVDLAGVGRNMKDHLMAGPTYKTKPGTSSHYLKHPVKAVSTGSGAFILTDPSYQVYFNGFGMGQVPCPATQVYQTN
jgi:choline dehydrogenase-like flavoprotein